MSEAIYALSCPVEGMPRWQNCVDDKKRIFTVDSGLGKSHDQRNAGGSLTLIDDYKEFPTGLDNRFPKGFNSDIQRLEGTFPYVQLVSSPRNSKILDARDIVIEARDRKLSPHLEIVDGKGEIVAGSTILPVKATLVVNDKEEVHRGQTLVKIPKEIGKTRDITGGLPRVAELFESRKPTNPAVMTEINGTVKFGETRRGIRKIHVVGDDGQDGGSQAD